MRSGPTARSGQPAGARPAAEDEVAPEVAPSAVHAGVNGPFAEAWPAGEEGGAEALRRGLRALARRTDDMAARTQRPR